MMHNVFLDIETIPGADASQLLPHFSSKVQESLKLGTSTIESLQRELCLSPATGRIVCICTLVESEAGVSEWRFPDVRVGLPSTENWEKSTLTQFWNAYSDMHGGYTNCRLITFNGKRFDVPFILLRSSILGVEPTRPLPFKKFDSKYHADLYEQLSPSTNLGSSMKFWLEALDLPSKTGEGKTVQDMWEAKRYTDILDYCADDCRRLRVLYHLVEQYSLAFA